MKILYLFVLTFTVYSWTVDYSSSTLLTTCEGENLQSCVTQAESILQNTNMTFPDDNTTLQLVCSMWEDMTSCMQNYTKRCLTYKENQEFHQYFEEPMSSMKTVCFDKESTKEYFRHAHCIKKISTGEKYCGTQYHIMIDQILSVNINTMKKICCALADFKDCVMKINVNHVCGGGPEEKHPNDGDIAKYALKTLDKSLLAFVAHSCHQEGFYRPGRCKNDDEPRNDLGYYREARNEGFETTANPFPGTTNDLESSASMTFTLKPLLVPLLPEERPQASIQVNITNTGDRGKNNKPDFSSKIKTLELPKGHSNLSVSFQEKVHLNLSTSLRNKINSTEKWTSQLSVVDDVLAAKVRNASLKYQNPLVNYTVNGKTAGTGRRVDSGGPSSKDQILMMGNSSSTVPLVLTNSSRNSRVGGGRAFNFITPNQQVEENKIVSKIAGFYNSSSSYEITKPTAIIGSSNTKANFAIPSWTTAPAKTTTSTRKTTSTTAATTTTTTTTTTFTTSTTTAPSSTTTRVADILEEKGDASSRTKSPRIVNNWDTLRDLNRALGLSPPSTTPSTKKIDIKSRKNQPEQLNLSNSTKAEESKNSGNFSASEVPIKVFMVWLSTFFV